MIKINRNTVIAVVTVTLALFVVGGGAYILLRPEQALSLKIASGSTGGTYFSFAKALAEVVNTHSSSVRMEVVNSSGANDNVNRISSGEADMGLIQSDTIVTKDVKIAARLFPEMFHLIARKSAGIKSIHDLRGKRIALPPQGSGSNALFTTLSNHYEISLKDMTIEYGGLSDGIKALEDNKVDAMFVVMAMGNEKLRSIIKTLDVELISIDQASAISLYYPALRAETIPVGAYSGEKPIPAKAISILAVDSLLAVSGNLDDEIVKEVTRILFEKRQELIRKIPQGAFIGQPTDEHKLAFDIHNGAESFYNKNEPPFFVKYAEQIGLGITVILLVFSSVWQLRSWLSDSRKNRADHYNKDLIDITKRVNKAKSIDELEAMREELFAIFQQVISDLDKDRLEEKSLQSFSIAWEVASSNLNHRQLVLTNMG